MNSTTFAANDCQLSNIIDRASLMIRKAIAAAFRRRGQPSPYELLDLRNSINRLLLAAELGPEALQDEIHRQRGEHVADEDRRVLRKAAPEREAELFDELLLEEAVDQVDASQQRGTATAVKSGRRPSVDGHAADDVAELFRELDDLDERPEPAVHPETVIGALRLLRHSLHLFLVGMTYHRIEKGVSPQSKAIAHALATGAGDALDEVVTRIDEMEKRLVNGEPVGPALQGGWERLWHQMHASIPNLLMRNTQAKFEAIQDAKRDGAGELAGKLLEFIEAIDFGNVDPDQNPWPENFTTGVEIVLNLIRDELEQLRQDVRFRTPAAALLEWIPDMQTTKLLAQMAIEQLSADGAGEKFEQDTDNKPPMGGSKGA